MSGPPRITTVAPQGRMVAIRRDGMTLLFRCPITNRIFTSMVDHAKACDGKHPHGCELERIEDRRSC